MGLMDYLKGQFLEIIQWQDDSRHHLVALPGRYPGNPNAARNSSCASRRRRNSSTSASSATRLVRANITLTTDNIPILHAIKGLEVWF